MPMASKKEMNAPVVFLGFVELSRLAKRPVHPSIVRRCVGTQAQRDDHPRPSSHKHPVQPLSDVAWPSPEGPPAQVRDLSADSARPTLGHTAHSGRLRCPAPPIRSETMVHGQ